MSLFEAIILGLVQGITEFLPISSSGHLVLIQDFMSIDVANALALDAVLHLATTIALVMYFWPDVWTVLQAALRRLGRLPVNVKDITLFKALVLGTVPATIIGLLIESYVDKSLQTPGVVAGTLFIASVFFMYAEWRYFARPVHEVVTPKSGFIIGLFQVLALLPGFSRTGATIAGGMLLGMSRYDAVRFSFLLAIPVTFGVGVKKLLELITTGGGVDWTPIVFGSVVAFFVSLAVIHLFLSYVRKYTLWPFIWYSVILSALVGYVSFIS
jgi:undecaprenyl-diphosphatase